jgi:hypothetical protein
MQGTISFDGTLSGGITDGGGGGSEVTITPVLTEGTKIADYNIDGTPGELYAPDSGSELSITPNYNAGFKVADYSIDGVAGVLYAPLTVNQGVSPLEVIGNRVRIDLSDYYDKTDCNDTFQKILTPGNHITIDSEDVISATGFPPDYAITEQMTSRKWIDGKNIYQLTISIPTYPSIDFTISLADYNIDQVVDLISTAKSYYTYDGGIHWDDRRFVGNYSTQGSNYFLIYRIEGDHETPLNLRCVINGFPITRLSSYHTIYYTKTI